MADSVCQDPEEVTPGENQSSLDGMAPHDNGLARETVIQQAYMAAQGDHGSDILQKLVEEQRWNVNSRTKFGLTPLHMMATLGDTRLAKVMIDNGADVNAMGSEGHSPLHWAVFNKQLGMVKMLAEEGGDVHAEDFKGITPLHWAVAKGELDLVKILVDKGSDVNAGSKSHVSPLHTAVSDGHFVIADILIDCGADVNAQTVNGISPLHCASSDGNLHLVRQLIERKANLNAINADGNTPLHFAAKKGTLDVMTLLLEFGADPNAEAKDGSTPLDLAAFGARKDMLQVLLQAGAQVGNFTKLFARGDSEIEKILEEAEERCGSNQVLHYERRQDLKYCMNPGKILYRAAEDGDVNKVRVLLQSGVNPDVFKDLNGMGALHMAAGYGHFDCAELLIRSKCDLRAINNQDSPLHLAAKGGFQKIVEILCKTGGVGLIGVKNQKGRIACQLAYEMGHSCVAHYLETFHDNEKVSRWRHILLTDKKTLPPLDTDVKVQVWADDERHQKLSAVTQYVYTMRHRPRGLALIINIDKVGIRGKGRPGSKVDAQRMNQLWQQLHFNTEIYTDLSSERCIEVLKDVATDESLSELDCLVVCLMGHGQHGEILAADNQPLSIQEVISQFNNKRCPALKGKPKIFLVQSCRGVRRDSGIETDDGDLIQTEDHYMPGRLPDVSDHYVMYSTAKGYVSHRNSITGSYFIKAVADVFSRFACEEHLLELGTKIIDVVAKEDMGGYVFGEPSSKQCPEISQVSLRKKLFFFPGK